MKKNHVFLIKLIVLGALGFWVLSKIPFYATIHQEVPAQIFENGVATGETTVFMEGRRSNYLFSKEQNYWGRFHVDCFERTGREGMHAGIRWDSDPVQRITYSQNASFPLTGKIAPFLLIEEEMGQFALEFADGRVVATSEEMYRKYREIPWTWRLNQGLCPSPSESLCPAAKPLETKKDLVKGLF